MYARITDVHDFQIAWYVHDGIVRIQTKIFEFISSAAKKELTFHSKYATMKDVKTALRRYIDLINNRYT